MQPEIWAEWLRRRDHFVVRTASSYWYRLGPRILQGFPYHWIIDPSEGEIRKLLLSSGSIGLRYSTPITARAGAASYQVAFTGESYDLGSVHKKARHDILRGLAIAEFDRLSMASLAIDGWMCRTETLARQGREGAESMAWWQKLCKSAEGLPGFESWAALADGQVVACLLAFTCGDCCTILYQQSRTPYLRSGINNALTYVFTRDVIARRQVRCVFYGLHSLDAPPSVDEYKFRMGYQPEPIRQRVVFHPWVVRVVNQTTIKSVTWLRQQRPRSPTLAKAEGMLRFYMQGERPLDCQIWPTCLSTYQQQLQELNVT